MASNKRIELTRIEPPRLVIKIRSQVAHSFPVVAKIVADNVASCEVFLRFDELVLEEITLHPNLWQFPGPYVEEEVQWELRCKQAATETPARIEARANGLFQLSVLEVEIT